MLVGLAARVAPCAILPGIIEGVAGSGDGGDVGRQYESSAPHRLHRQGGDALADGLLRLGLLYVKLGR